MCSQIPPCAGIPRGHGNLVWRCFRKVIIDNFRTTFTAICKPVTVMTNAFYRVQSETVVSRKSFSHLPEIDVIPRLNVRRYTTHSL